MIYLLGVYIEHNLNSLNTDFLYLSNNKVEIGSRVLVNFKNQKLVGFVLNVEEKESFNKNDYSFEVKEILEIIDEKPILNKKSIELAKEISKYYFYPLIGVLNTFLPPSLKPKSSSLNKPKIAYNYYYFLKDKNYNPINIHESKILDKFSNSDLILKSSLSKSKTLENLINKKVIEIREEEKYRYEFEKKFQYESQITLSDTQKKCYEEIKNTSKNVSLLKGVTGSGKTEIYLKLMEDTLRNNKTCILLVPEVALTPLMISRVLSYFNEEIAVLHSSLKDSERYDEFRKISENKIRIVIGTRSAIFAPLDNLGLIIIDEEHDSSYKQDDNLTYNAKDIALLRLKFEKNLKIVLGSATPSIDTLYKAKKGLYELVTLDNKYFNDYKTEIIKVDFKNPDEFTKSKIFSNTLIHEINEIIKNNKQAILLINARGYSKFTYCKNCGFVYKCPTCNLPLIYHKEDNKLHCHRCDFKMNFKRICPKCESNEIYNFGYGIEKVEEEFKNIFPNIDYLVLNSDKTPTLKEIESVLLKFNNKEANILIGTQIISKGHDFKDCDFVGIINIDNLLRLPTYKANEETFDLIVQTIGRTGRKNKGKALIQTSFPRNKIINYALNNDYNSFYEFELERRKKYNYPPFNNFVGISFESIKKDKVEYYSNFFKERFDEEFKDCLLEGPSLITKYKNGYRNFIYLKVKNIKNIKEDLIYIIEKFNSKNEIKISLNFSPFDL